MRNGPFRATQLLIGLLLGLGTGCAPHAEPASHPVEESIPPAVIDAAPPSSPEAQEVPVIVLAPGLRVDREHGIVEADGFICIDAGFLEQVACRRGTREHESLFTPVAMPSAIHAALLLAGFTPGHPGRWHMSDEGELRLDPPTGDPIEILLRIGTEPARPVAHFIRDARSEAVFPGDPFIFAGSEFRPNPPSFGPGEHYVADGTGSIVGLVTFGDEVVAWREVIPDDSGVVEPAWVARSSELPPPGSPATLILRRASQVRASP